RMDAGFARMDAMDARMEGGFARMDAMDARMEGGFARVDHFFELQHAQHQELRADVRKLTERVDALTERVGGLEREVAHLRNYMTREIGEIRLELRDLRARADQTDEVRREIAGLTARVD